MSNARYKLTKQCPAELYYSGKTAKNSNVKQKAPLLNAFVDRGIQMLELPKCNHTSGININTLGYHESLSRTNDATQKAISYHHYIGKIFSLSSLLRTCILVKLQDFWKFLCKVYEVRLNSVLSVSVISSCKFFNENSPPTIHCYKITDPMGWL